MGKNSEMRLKAEVLKLLPTQAAGKKLDTVATSLALLVESETYRIASGVAQNKVLTTQKYINRLMNKQNLDLTAAETIHSCLTWRSG